MTSITVSDLDDFILTGLQARAAQHGRSMEDEALDILRCELARDPEPSLAVLIRAHFADVGFVDLPEIPREPGREPPNFEDDA